MRDDFSRLGFDGLDQQFRGGLKCVGDSAVAQLISHGIFVPSRIGSHFDDIFFGNFTFKGLLMLFKNCFFLFEMKKKL